jgi:hypothetical protein
MVSLRYRSYSGRPSAMKGATYLIFARILGRPMVTMPEWIEREAAMAAFAKRLPRLPPACA